jgi:ABC-type Fe3+-hydroxamate transport system substrate-binding protein
VSVLRFRHLATALLLASPACARREGGGATRGIADDLGARVALASPAQRIVSLSPSTTELLFTIGAGDRMVGRTRWCDYPPEVAGVPNVGDGLNPNVELVLSRRPDLVVFYASPANQSAIARLEGVGVAHASLRLDRLDDLARGARLLGVLTGNPSRADSLATVFTTTLDSARAAASAPSAPGVPPRARWRVAVLVWDNPPVVIGAGSFLSELLALAGARNVFDDISQPSAPTSIEAIAARDPDLVVVLGKTMSAELSSRPEWRNVSAVGRHRFVTIEGSEFERPSFRALAAVRRLRAAIEGATVP